MDLVEIWRTKSIKKEKFDACFKYVVGKIGVNAISDEMKKEISQKIIFFFLVNKGLN